MKKSFSSSTFTGAKVTSRYGSAGPVVFCETGERKARVAFLPELMELDGVVQNSHYHQYDVLTHILKTVDEVPSVLVLRWAALLHDVAKGRPGIRFLNRRGEVSDRGHHLAGAGMAKRILGRLKVSRRYTQRIAWLIKNHRDLPGTGQQEVIKWAIRRSQDFTNRHEFMEAARQLFLLGRANDASRVEKPIRFTSISYFPSFPKSCPV